jgi:hypothetical protein
MKGGKPDFSPFIFVRGQAHFLNLAFANGIVAEWLDRCELNTQEPSTKSAAYGMKWLQKPVGDTGTPRERLPIISACISLL